MTKNAAPVRSPHKNRGIFIVFFAVFMVVVLGLLALVLGLGMISVSSVQIQQLSNLSALSALEGYFASTDEDPADRAEFAAARATEVISNNRVLGTKEDIANLSDDRALRLPWESGGINSVGTITFGEWYNEDPDGTDPCTGSYPCFVPWEVAGSPPPQINAARVLLRNDVSNPILAPFVKIFLSDDVSLTREATATLVQRCTAYLLDVSISSVAMTHPLPPQPPQIIVPPNSAFRLRWRIRPQDMPSRLFAYRLGQMPFGYNSLVYGGDNPQFNLYTQACALNFLSGWNGDEVSPNSNHEAHIWCNTIYDPTQGSANQNWRARPPCVTPQDCTMNSTEVFPQDYVDQDTVLGRVRYDAVRDPQPLSDFLLAFNAGLRLVREQATSGDRAAVLPFDGQLRSPYPVESASANLTPNLDILVQLTNARGRSRVASVIDAGAADSRVRIANSWTPAIEPNFITLGWFPVYTADASSFSQTDIVNAVEQAMNRLVTSCPASAKKDIIIATDGVATCSRERGCPTSLDYDYFSSARQELLDEAGTGVTRLKPALRANRIAVSTLLAGADVQPNFVNRRRDPGNPSSPFVNLSEASALGFGSNFFNDSPELPAPLPAACTTNGWTGNDCAYRMVGQPGVKFREPNSVFGRLAFETGGVFCPMMPPCSNDPAACPACSGESCYTDPTPLDPGRLKDCARVEDATQTCSLTNEDMGAQAARCVLQAIGGNPYILAE
jgi:hypothetical protein